MIQIKLILFRNNIYATLPSSLKTDLQTRSRFEDPEIQDQRRQITQSKSVSELSQIQTLGDFPIPTTIEKLMQNRGHNELTRDATKTSIFSGDGKLEENIYATLPRSLKAEVLVRSRIEDPEVLGLSHSPEIQFHTFFSFFFCCHLNDFYHFVKPL